MLKPFYINANTSTFRSMLIYHIRGLHSKRPPDTSVEAHRCIFRYSDGAEKLFEPQETALRSVGPSVFKISLAGFADDKQCCRAVHLRRCTQSMNPGRSATSRALPRLPSLSSDLSLVLTNTAHTALASADSQSPTAPCESACRHPQLLRSSRLKPTEASAGPSCTSPVPARSSESVDRLNCKGHALGSRSDCAKTSAKAHKSRPHRAANSRESMTTAPGSPQRQGLQGAAASLEARVGRPSPRPSLRTLGLATPSARPWKM